MASATTSQGIYDYIMERLTQSGRTYREVSTGSGVSIRTIEKIARKEIRDPGVSHVQKIHDYFRAIEARRAN